MKIPTIVLMHEKYKNTERLVANTAFNKINLIGSIAGLMTVGILSLIYPKKGLWIASGFILLLFLVFCLGNYIYKLYYRKIIFSSLSIFQLHK